MEENSPTSRGRTASAPPPSPVTVVHAIAPKPSDTERRAIIEALRRAQLTRNTHDSAWARRARADTTQQREPGA